MLRQITFICALIYCIQGVHAVDVEILSPGPQASFAAQEIRAALEDRQTTKAGVIQLKVAPRPGLESEGYAIGSRAQDQQQQILVTGADPAGLMYGGLEIAEIIRTRGLEAIGVDLQNPYMKMRGIKFNIPLDLRSPSYTDPCDAAQINMPEMWSFDFWRELIDSLARHRYNYISLWSLHPFPSLVKVPGYEDVALDDIWRSKVISKREYYPGNGTEFLGDELTREVEVIKKLTIAEKIAFWRRVMAHGKSRNVDFYVITWNIFDCGTFGKYGITDRADNPKTTDYFRKSVKQMFLTYPDLAGIGLTTGENMPRMSTAKKEDWAFATYGQGVLDAARELPGRKITFIHRQHQTGAKDIARRFKPLVDHPNVEFIFSFKYAKAHVMSALEQPYHLEFVKDISRNDLKTIWTLRNDSNYYYRWSAPDFVRQFIRNIPYDVSRGYYYGSDGFTWGRDFLQRRVDGSRELDINRHWCHWLLWGRLGYDPDFSNERIRDLYARRFGISKKMAAALFEVWQTASMIYPTVTGFHWGMYDFQWYIEGCHSRPGFAQNKTGFHDVNRFISLGTHPSSGNQSIPDYVKMVRSSGTTKLKTPLDVANALEQLASKATTLAREIDPGDNKELARTLDDIRTVGVLGLYYAHKIRGATELALFRETKDKQHQKASIVHLQYAARQWKAYVEMALEHYRNPLWTNRVGWVDWKRNYRYALDDIRIAGGDPEKLGLPLEMDAAHEPIKRRW